MLGTLPFLAQTDLKLVGLKFVGKGLVSADKSLLGLNEFCRWMWLRIIAIFMRSNRAFGGLLASGTCYSHNKRI